MQFGTKIKETQLKCCTKEDYINMREQLKQHGVNKFYQEMLETGIFKDGSITSELKPFNPFARIIHGKMENPCKDTIENPNFVLLQNRPDNDEHWQDSSPEWIGKASMSKNHKFLSPKNPTWSLFNVLTLGMDQIYSLESCINLLNEMEKVALQYTKQKMWSNNIGLYFHCYPFNSIQTLHLHIVDLETIGPSYSALNYKNLTLSAVRDVLLEELHISKL